MMEAAEGRCKLDPNDGLTHQVLGMAYAYQGKTEQALAEFAGPKLLHPPMRTCSSSSLGLSRSSVNRDGR